MLTGVLYSCENVGLSHIHPDVTPAVNLQRLNLLNRGNSGKFPYSKHSGHSNEANKPELF